MTSKTKSVIIAAVVALALAAGAFLYFTPPAAAPGPENGLGDNPPVATSTPGPAPTPSVPTPTPQPPAPGGITMAQVAAHAGASSCWTVIRGNVYDLTAWISKHPGGKQAILQLCGKDGTAKFTAQHGGSPNPESALATFKIGVLAQ